MHGGSRHLTQLPIFAISLILLLYYSSLPFYLSFVSVALSVPLLYLGTEALHSASMELSHRLGLSARNSGQYLLSVASVVDEIALVAVAVVYRQDSIALGAILGSSVVTLAAFLLIMPWAVPEGIRQFRRDGIFLVVPAALLLLATFLPQGQEIYGTGMLAVAAAYVVLSRSGTGDETVEGEVAPPGGLVSALSCASVVVGAWLLVRSTESISMHYSLNPLVASFIVAGIVESLPEIVMLAISLVRDPSETSTGIVSGSSIYKATAILAVPLLAGQVLIGGYHRIPALFLITALLFLAYTFFRQRKISVAVTLTVLVVSAFLL